MSSNKSSHRSVVDTVLVVLGVGMALYHLVSTQVLLQEPLLHLNTHLFLGLLLVFLVTLKKSRKRWWPAILILVVATIVATGYVHFNRMELEARAFVNTTTDIVMGFILLFLIFEACRQAFGIVLPLVGLVFIAYSFFGYYIPGAVFQVGRMELSELMARLTIGASNSGLYGESPLMVSVNFIFLFVLFGGLMQASGAIDLFMMIGKLAMRKLRGGAAMTAVISSALVGSVTGSAVANVGITGSVTIPMMKRIGYKPEQAGAIEAVASTGGQIMPPVMGAAAFMMAQLLGIPYVKVMAVAILPALLYFFVAGTYVQLQAMKLDIRAEKESVDIKQLLLRLPIFLLPLSVIVILLVKHFSPMYAAFWAIVTIVLTGTVISFLGPAEKRISFSTWVQGFADGALGGARIAVSCAMLGPMIGVLLFTGLGVTAAAQVEAWSGGILGLALLLTMVVAIILGMGAPTLVAYTLVAVVICPVLVRMGLPLLPAHYYAFIFAVYAAISPPVAMASIMGAAIAGSNFFKTAITSMRIALPAFLIPFLVVFAPVLLLNPTDLLSSITNLGACIIGLFALTAALSNFYLVRPNFLETILLWVTGLSAVTHVVTQSYVFFFVAAGCFAVVTGWQWNKRKRLSSNPNQI